MARAGSVRGDFHRVDGVDVHRRTRSGFRADADRAIPAGGPRSLVLRGQAAVASRPDVHLPALDIGRAGMVAISVPGRSGGIGGRAVARRPPPPRADGRISLLRWNAFSSAWFPECLS